MTGRPRRCRVCRVRPPAMPEVPFCFECWPGGPVIPPPCRKCGSTEDYYTSGLCARCHTHAPGERSPVWRLAGPLAPPVAVVDSCPDCHAWGATRTYGWLCAACRSWRETHPHVDDCRTCGQRVALDQQGSCRLCRKTRSLLAHELGKRTGAIDLVEANRCGQQLFFAGMWHREGHGTRPYIKKTVPPDLSLLRPVGYQQLVLWELPRDLKSGLRHGFPPPPHPAREAAWHQFVREFADEHGWGINVTERTQRVIRMLLGMQDTPGAAIRASDVLPMSSIRHPIRPALDVLAAAGMLADDRVPAVLRWFTVQTAALPADMRRELTVWFDIARHGSAATSVPGPLRAHRPLAIVVRPSYPAALGTRARVASGNRP